MTLKERLLKKKSGGISSLREKLLSDKKNEKSPLDLRELLTQIVREEVIKLAEPITAQVIETIDTEKLKASVTPKKGKDYIDGRHGKNGVDGKGGKDGKNGRDGRNGKDGKDGANGKDGSPDTAKQVVEKMNEVGGVLITSIENLPEELKAIKDRIVREAASKGGGGGMGNPQHDQFIGNGVLTSFTLTHNVAANGTAVFGCRYQGQTLYLGDQFTISGKNLTTVGFVPDDGTKIEITYIRT